MPQGDANVRRPRRSLITFLWRFGLVVVLVLTGSLGGLGYTLLAPATYTATAYVLVVNGGSDQSGPAAVSFAQVFGRLAPLPETLEYSSLPLPRTPAGAIRKHVQASTSPDTPLIRITGSARTPADAAAYANAAADALVQYGTARRPDTGVRVALMNLAEPPATPSSPNLVLDVAVGTASGILLAGLGAALVSGRRGRGGTPGRDAAGHAPVPEPAPEPQPALERVDRVEVRP
ncbi:YveK family protein [Actinomadura formosensis]|uniref:lipopolysaccharide biosynthesis protein n=2 Tax=Actinomadura formosensis TaxID=60706 RepID=UPI0010415D23|nr:lipopolysaccharide biosynthesis protein [Actinomadura formosensis]